MALIIGALLVVVAYLYMEGRHCYNPGKTFLGALVGANKLVVAEIAVQHSIRHTETGILENSVVEVSWLETQRFFVDFIDPGVWSVSVDRGGNVILLAPPIKAFTPGTIYTDSVRTYFLKSAFFKNDTRHMLETTLLMSKHSKKEIAKRLNSPKDMERVKGKARKSLTNFIRSIATKLDINVSSVTIIFEEEFYIKRPIEIVTPQETLAPTK